MNHIQDTVTLNNGVKMPRLGLGVWKVTEGDEVVNAVKTAIDIGYRSIDTAKIYGNEAGVGQAIQECGVDRRDLFITTKLWNDDQGYESTLAALDASLERLDLEYVDLYLIHWPGQTKYKETWRAMEKAYQSGKVRAIGVSNFHRHHLEDLLSSAKVIPTVNQIELHPLLNQAELREYCKEKNIVVEAWSPLGRGSLLDHPLLQDIARKHDKTTAQVILRWNLQHGIITILKSTNPGRIRENSDIFNFELSKEDMQQIDGLNENQRLGADPDEVIF